MLHIILFVLEIFGWILLAVVCLAILCILVFLLMPLRYKGRMTCEGDLETLCVYFEYSWFFSLIKGKILYRNQRFKWRMRLLWKRLPGQGEKKRPVEKSLYREEKASYDSDIFEKDTVEVHEKSKELKRDTSDREQAETGRRKPKRFSFKKIYEKIRYTIIKICDNIKILLKKKECIEDFLTDYIHKAALKRTGKEIKRLFSFLLPGEIKIRLKFGFSDPAVTGYALGGVSMIYPFIAEYAQIEPDFEHKVLEGQAFIKGKIRGGYLAVFLWNMVWDKNVRRTFFDIRDFQI